MRVHEPGGVEFFTLLAGGCRNSLHFWPGGVGILYTCVRLAAFLECLPCGTGGLGGNLANRSMGRVKVGHISPKGNGGLARVVAFHGMGHSLLAAFPAIRAL